jgi:GNAT superfamily N-acetyltransferase
MTGEWREAEPKDASVIVQWFATHADARQWGGPDVPDPWTGDWLATEFTGGDRYRVLMAEGPAAIFALRPAPDGDSMHLRRMAVAPALRGTGLATAVLMEARRLALEAGAARLTLNVYGSNGVAQAVYRRDGFLVEARLPAPEDASGYRLFMYRPLV